MTQSPAVSAPVGLPEAIAPEAQRLIVRSLAAYAVTMIMAFVLADALQPVSEAFVVAAVSAICVIAGGCVLVAWWTRRTIVHVLQQPAGPGLWAYLDYSSVWAALFPAITAVVAAAVASVVVELAHTNAAGNELVITTGMLALAGFPGMHAVLSGGLQRVGSWHHAESLPRGHAGDGRVHTAAMIGLGTRVAMAVAFTTLAAVVWFAMFVMRLSDGAPTGGGASVTLAAGLFLVVAVFNALTIRASLRLSIESVRRQILELQRGGTRMVATPGLDELGQLATEVREYAVEQATLALRIRAAADGDLAVRFTGHGAVAQASTQLLETARDLVRTVEIISARLGEDAHAIHDHAATVETDAREQSLNVDESRRTMLGLRQCSLEINNESHELNAASQDVLAVNEHTASQISELVDHQVQVEELLDTVREIAERSDILALNASLEGVRAGETGRGFSLVASEMRRMAEKVKSAASDIRQIVANVRTSARATMAATEEAQRVGERMKKSVERIALIASQQQTSTAQVTTNIADVASYLQQASDDTVLARDLAESLSDQAVKLHGLVEHFRVPVLDDWGGSDDTGGVVFDSDDNIIVFRPSGRHGVVESSRARAVVDDEHPDDARAREAVEQAVGSAMTDAIEEQPEPTPVDDDRDTGDDTSGDPPDGDAGAKDEPEAAGDSEPDNKPDSDKKSD